MPIRPIAEATIKKLESSDDAGCADEARERVTAVGQTNIVKITATDRRSEARV